MQSLSRKIIVLVMLLGSAGVFGYLIYNGGKNNDSGDAIRQSQNRKRILTEQEKAALDTPKKDADEAEKRRHFEIVQPLAVEAKYLDISTCIGDPVVLKIKEKKEIIVKNNDAVEHTIQIDPKHLYPIPAKGMREIIADFGFGPGTYGYGCDNSIGAAGIFFVTK